MDRYAPDRYRDRFDRDREDSDRYDNGEYRRRRSDSDYHRDEPARRPDESRYRDEQVRFRDESTRHYDERTRYHDEHTRSHDERTQYRDEPPRDRDGSGRYRNDPPRYRDDRSRSPPFQFGRNPYSSSRLNYDNDDPRPGDFTFRSQADHPAPQFSREQARSPPRALLDPSRRGRGSNFAARTRGSIRDRGGRGARGWGRSPYVRVATSDRPLLQGNREPTPEQMLEMNEGEARFRQIDHSPDVKVEDTAQGPNMTVKSEATEINERYVTLSPRDSTQEPQLTFRFFFHSSEPPRKRTHVTSLQKADGDSVPKWSNPDPYTALPPVLTQTERKDVVQLIRSAKVTVSVQKNPVADGDDFIRFDSGAPAESESSSSEDDNATLLNTTGRKFSHLDKLHPNRHSASAINVRVASDVAPPLPLTVDPGSPPPMPLELRHLEAAIDIRRSPRRSPAVKPSKKKRGHAEISDDESAAQEGTRRAQRVLGCQKLSKHWYSKPNENPAPWHIVENTASEDVGVKLHKEIVDFFEYVRPRAFEQEVRQAMVRRLQRFVDHFPGYAGAEVTCFGSFPAGIYLPDADMDIVVRSSYFIANGRANVGQGGSALRKFSNGLLTSGFADRSSLIVIGKARVPLVKYVDVVTGLKVDISFENNTGITAITTYRNWAMQFPAMPVILTLIKQFLLMRGLNEVHTGGLGGFTLNCLVVSLMQHLPQMQSGNMNPTQNYGELLMQFFDFYGNNFNTKATGISMYPANYFAKVNKNYHRYTLS